MRNKRRLRLTFPVILERLTGGRLRAPFFSEAIQNNGMNVPFCSFMYKSVLTIQYANNDFPRSLPKLIQFSSISAVCCTTFVRNMSAQQKDNGQTNYLPALAPAAVVMTSDAALKACRIFQ
jgi:hypothetical protein